MGELKFTRRADNRMGLVEVLGEAAVKAVDDDYEIPAQAAGLPMMSLLRRRPIPAVAIDVVASGALGVLAGMAALSQRAGDIPFGLAIAVAATAIGWDYFADRRHRALQCEMRRLLGWQAAERRLNARHRAHAQTEIHDLQRELFAHQETLRVLETEGSCPGSPAQCAALLRATIQMRAAVDLPANDRAQASTKGGK